MFLSTSFVSTGVALLCYLLSFYLADDGQRRGGREGEEDRGGGFAST